jgi:DNA-binding PadR family transcriptional regulator
MSTPRHNAPRLNAPRLNPTAASLLGFLHDGPKTGWELQQAVDASIGNFWNVTRSQVYRELKTLAEMELVTAGVTGQRDRVPYKITKAGRAEFAKWISREPEGGVMRLPLAVTVFFGSHVEPALLRRYLQAARIEHQNQRDDYVAIRPRVTEPFERSTLELGIAYEEMWLRWLSQLPWIEAPKTRR